MNTKTYFASRKGFTLIELLVVIGILAVLAAIAIPSVAGLIDRANVSADKTNTNEMANAIERFTSEYELYCQDVASGTIKDADNNGVPDDMDAAQGRVFNVTGAVTRADITALESTGLDGMQINRDTKYPVNAETARAVIENYTKTSSSTFEPKQSDMHYWYSPDCGVVVFAEPNADIETDLNAQIQSGQDAKGNQLDGNTKWINLTTATSLNDGNGNNNQQETAGSATFYRQTMEGCTCIEEYGVHECLFNIQPVTLTWEELKDPANGKKYNYDASRITNTEIKGYAFHACDCLESIVIPSNVTFVGSNAFWDTAGIQNVTFAGTTSQWNAIEFDDDWNDCLHVTVIHCTDGDIVLS